jgi:DNA-binding transcriptional ArsR family regulator
VGLVAYLFDPILERVDRLRLSVSYHSHMRANIDSVQSDIGESEEICGTPCFKVELVKKLQGQLPSDETLEDALIVFTALSDRARIKILFALQDEEELCVCDVAHVIGTSISMASHHLRKLRDLKLVKYRNDGRMSYYSLRNQLAAKLIRDVLRGAAE